MCGIAGYVGARKAFETDLIEGQLRQLEHRGPDSLGWFGDGRGVVGQTRLSIIDLVTGDPPQRDGSGRIGVALNGEIYDFARLREELAADGHRFRSTGDTEVIAHLAEDLTPIELARRLGGMFAVAVWDTRHERLVLIRDRAGKKPLYWWQGPNGVVFGSEIKSVIAHPWVPVELDESTLPAYLRFGYVPSPRTMYRGIRQVPPGHVLIVERDLSVTCTPYWSVTAPGAAAGRLDLTLDEAAAEVRAGLRTAVRRRLVTDVPLGAFLSGGIDSSAVVALMAEAVDRPVQTFTIGFEDADGFDERPFAQEVADRFGTDHTTFVVAPQAVDLVERLVWHHDQPFGDSSAVPMYLLSELTRRHVTVALSGDGGDELFAGYERFAAGTALGSAGRLPGLADGSSRLASLLHPAPGTRAAKAKRLLEAAGAGLPHAYRSLVAYVPDRLVDELVTTDDRWDVDDYQAIWDSTTGAATLDRLLLLNFRTYLLDDLLPKVDRMSMAHGLEVRAPFLDHELVELAFRLPTSTKLRGTSLKRSLRHAFRDVLPPSILDRPKRGFGVPLDRWFRDDLAAMLEVTLAAPDARVRKHLRAEAIDGILGEHRTGRANHGHILWTLLTLEIFLRRMDW